MRLSLVPKETNVDFFSRSWLSLGLSGVLMVISIVAFLVFGPTLSTLGKVMFGS